MSNITIYEYLAYNVPNDCVSLLERYDIVSAQNESELIEDLKAFVRQYKEEGLKELADIHPDKDLISELANLSTPYNGKAESEYLNASGTLDRLSNIETSMMSGNNESNALSKIDFLLGIGIAILTATLFRKE